MLLYIILYYHPNYITMFNETRIYCPSSSPDWRLR